MVGIKGKSGKYNHKTSQGFQKGHKLLRKRPNWNRGKKISKEEYPNYGMKGKVPWNKGLTKETDERVKKYSENGSKTQKGQHHSSNTEFKKGKIPWNKEKKLTKEHIQKLSKSWNYNKHFTEKTREKLRLSTFEYIKKIRDILFPNIGHNEKKILDRLEQELKYKILRQYKTSGYFIDGYIPELNLAIEIDERPKNREKDIEREIIIKNKLKCKFLRINDYD